MARQHTFSLSGDKSNGDPMGIKYGTWYFLKHNDKGNPYKIWLPVNEQISYDFQHTYKNIDALGGIGQWINDLQNNSILGSAMQRYAGSSVHVSGADIYQQSEAHNIAVVSRVFSPDGSGKLIETADKIRELTTGKIDMGGSSQSAGIQGGLIDHPRSWNVQVISFASGGEHIISDMPDMICNRCSFVLSSPYIGKDPQVMEIKLDFKFRFNSWNDSMKLGGAVSR